MSCTKPGEPTFLEDYTGYDWERPEMDTIRDIAKQGKINAIVVTRRDRFARGEDVALILEKMFAKMGVRLFSVQEGEFTPGAKNRILSAVERAQSEDVAEILKENMRLMRYHYIDNGAFPSQGVAKYGYRKEGKKANSRLVVCEEEAEIVHLIFDLFIQRYTYNQIADLLNEQGIARPALAKGLHRPSNTEGWNRAGVRNLIDDAQYYKGEYIPYKRANRTDEHVATIISVPAIINEEMYQKAQFIRETLRKTPMYTDYDLFTLARRLTCECGYAYAQQKTMRKKSLYRYYRCISTDMRYNRQKAHCSIRSLAADRVETVIWPFVKDLLLDPRTALAHYKRQQQKHQDAIDNATTHLQVVDELLMELRGEREQVLTLFRKRHIDEGRLDADIAIIDRQREKLEKERTRWTHIIEQYTVDSQQLISLEQIATSLRDRLESADRQTILTIYDKLKLKVHALTEEGKVVLYISILGDNAGKVAFSDSSAPAC